MANGDSAHSGRRTVLKAAVAALAAGAAAPALAQTQKLPKQAVMYQDTPKNGQKCSMCVQFVPPRACKIVEGDISPDGWCGAFQPKPA
jgi:hypothetical protein